MMQKPNIMLDTMNTERWIVLSTSAIDKKRKCGMKYYSMYYRAAAIIQSYNKRKEHNKERKILKRTFKPCCRL